MAPSEQKIFNVGVVGYGMSAKVFHIPFIATAPAFRLHSILQRNPTPESSAPEDHPGVKHFTSLEPFLADQDLDVVVLTTTPETHFPFTEQALSANKHVFVEKPFVATAAEADTLAELAQARNRVLCVYQNRRWDSDFLTVRRLLAAGTLGRIYEFATHFDRYRATAPTTWKGRLPMSKGGSALYDLGTHLVDQAYVLFGMPQSVFAKLTNQRDGRVLGPDDPSVEPDSINVQLFYAGGLTVHVRVGAMSAETRQPRFWIRGTKGSYHKDGLDTQEDQLKAGMKTSDNQFGKDPEAWHGRLIRVGEDEQMSEETWPNVEPVTYSKIYELFADSLRGAGPVPVPALEARDVLRILEAARESAMRRREIDLS
ncbi:hypothetical protein F4861DRAFT_532064 [Xylaria intraflava]|nr:hypothetical protein F4861DRAFT_532064 [Xylaria intraflava]